MKYRSYIFVSEPSENPKDETYCKFARQNISTWNLRFRKKQLTKFECKMTMGSAGQPWYICILYKTKYEMDVTSAVYLQRQTSCSTQSFMGCVDCPTAKPKAPSRSDARGGFTIRSLPGTNSTWSLYYVRRLTYKNLHAQRIVLITRAETC